MRKLCVSKYPVNWPPQPSAEAEAVHRANSADFVSFKQTKSSLGRHSLSENRTEARSSIQAGLKSHIMLKEKLCKFPTQNYKTYMVSGHPKSCTRKANLIIWTIWTKNSAAAMCLICILASGGCGGRLAEWRLEKYSINISNSIFIFINISISKSRPKK